LATLIRPCRLSPRTAELCQVDLFWGVVRHAFGDFGEVCADCRASNAAAWWTGRDVQSVYTDRHGRRFVVYTPPERTCTVVWLADEF
jgi:hypothetical protein